MLTWLMRWDRLGLRLFLPMWAALTVSHLAAWGVVTQALQGVGRMADGPPPMHAAGPAGPAARPAAA